MISEKQRKKPHTSIIIIHWIKLLRHFDIFVWIENACKCSQFSFYCALRTRQTTVRSFDQKNNHYRLNASIPPTKKMCVQKSSLFARPRATSCGGVLSLNGSGEAIFPSRNRSAVISQILWFFFSSFRFARKFWMMSKLQTLASLSLIFGAARMCDSRLAEREGHQS